MKINSAYILRALLLGFVVTTLSLSSCSTSKSTAATSNKPGAESLAKVNKDRDGSSFKDAIVVNSIREEYAYVKEVCPGCQMKSQALISEGKKYYDKLTFVNEDGDTVEYYFDINNFYGKGF